MKCPIRKEDRRDLLRPTRLWPTPSLTSAKSFMKEETNSLDSLPSQNYPTTRKTMQKRPKNYGSFWMSLLKVTFNPNPFCSVKANSLLSAEKSSVRKFLSQFTDKAPNQNVIKAAEMFSAAATKFKIGQQFEEAAKTFERCANTYHSADDRFGEVLVSISLTIGRLSVSWPWALSVRWPWD